MAAGRHKFQERAVRRAGASMPTIPAHTLHMLCGSRPAARIVNTDARSTTAYVVVAARARACSTGRCHPLTACLRVCVAWRLKGRVYVWTRARVSTARKKCLNFARARVDTFRCPPFTRTTRSCSTGDMHALPFASAKSVSRAPSASTRRCILALLWTICTESAYEVRNAICLASVHV